MWTRSKAGLKPGLYKLFCPQGSVQSYGAEGPGAKIHGLVADCAHERREFGRAKESRNGFWQVGIGGSISGNKPANPWQDVAKIPAIEISHQTLGWLGEFQDGDGAAGLQPALNLAQACFIVGEDSKAEGAGHQVKRSVCERKPESIGFKKRHRRCSALVQWRHPRDAFLSRTDEHGMGEIRADDASFSRTRERESEITSFTAAIEAKSIGPIENGMRKSGEAGTPQERELQ